MAYSLDDVKKAIKVLKKNNTPSNYPLKQADYIVDWLEMVDLSKNLEGFDNNLDGFKTEVLSLLEDEQYKAKVIQAWIKRKAGDNIAIDDMCQLVGIGEFDSRFWDAWLKTEAGKKFKSDISLQKVQELHNGDKLNKDALAYLITQSFNKKNTDFTKVETLLAILELYKSDTKLQEAIVKKWYEVNSDLEIKINLAQFKGLYAINPDDKMLEQFLKTENGQEVELDYIKDSTSQNILYNWFKTREGKKTKFADLEKFKNKRYAAEAWIRNYLELKPKSKNLIVIEDWEKEVLKPLTMENIEQFFNIIGKSNDLDNLMLNWIEDNSNTISVADMEGKLLGYANVEKKLIDKYKEVSGSDIALKRENEKKETALKRENEKKETAFNTKKARAENRLYHEKGGLLASGALAAGLVISLAVIAGCFTGAFLLPWFGLFFLLPIMIGVIGALFFGGGSIYCLSENEYFSAKSELKELVVEHDQEVANRPKNVVCNASVEPVTEKKQFRS